MPRDHTRRSDSVINTHIRERVKAVRLEHQVSQDDLAQHLGKSRAAVSDLERGRVQVNASDLFTIASFFRKPISYFLPAPSGAAADRQTELLNLLHQVPDSWQERIVDAARTQFELYRRIQPYEEVGIPDDYYGFLVWEELEILQAIEDLDQRGIPNEEDFAKGRELHNRYREWRRNVKTSPP